MNDTWISRADVHDFNHVRRLMRELERELEGGTRETRGTAHGRLAEAANRADEAIFNVLNVAQSFDLAELSKADVMLEAV